MDLRQFGRRTKKLADNVEKNVSKVVRQTALAVDSAVVIATPVDTGRARSNWQVSLNSAVTDTRDAYVEGKDRSTEAENTRATLNHAQDVVADYKADDTVFITNNLPYIGRLNTGHSAQAPAGFVEKAVLVGVDAIKKASSILKD